MTEDFIPFELAKKLKEKGFDEECLAYYTSEYTLYLNKVVLCDDKYLEVAEIDYEECLRSYNTQKDRLLRTIVDAPTISQVLKWLRKEKQLHIVIVTGHNIVTNTHLWGYKIWDLANHVWLHAKIADDSYELAALSGIEFVIDNLLL